MLQWWTIGGNYASALVAAETEERALELLRTHPDVNDEGWIGGDVAKLPPAPPPAEGVYGTWAE